VPPAGLSPHSETSFLPACLQGSHSQLRGIRKGTCSLMEPFSGVLVFINVLSDLHFNIFSIASGFGSVNLHQEIYSSSMSEYNQIII
jgi:hypothetical protein